MANENLDRVYQASGDKEMRKVYDEWADQYDSDVEGNGYLTPTRVAEAVAKLVKDKDAPVMDYGCGTGLSGVALDEAGFSHIDGADLSQKMLDIARGTKVYEKLDLIEPDAELDRDLGQYGLIVAVGVISKGAAPPSLYNDMLNVMAPGAILAFSMNDLSLAEDEYTALVPASVDDGKVKLLHEEYGPHLTKYGDNSKSKVFVVQKR